MLLERDLLIGSGVPENSHDLWPPLPLASNGAMLDPRRGRQWRRTVFEGEEATGSDPFREGPQTIRGALVAFVVRAPSFEGVAEFPKQPPQTPSPHLFRLLCPLCDSYTHSIARWGYSGRRPDDVLFLSTLESRSQT